ncbi:MAG: hypothetical protein AAF513_03520 [Pseudomonadota bacterium]
MSDRASRFHANPWHGVFYVTGGGSPLLAEMLSTAGASGTVLEAQVPYAAQALTDLLGRAPERASSTETALQLAITAYQRAQALGTQPLFGLGCSAALATNRDRRGSDRAHWALQLADATYGFSAAYEDGDRAQQEAALLAQLWASLQMVFEDEAAPDDVTCSQARVAAPMAALLEGEPHKTCTQPHHARLILPGSFNPVHDGHKRMLSIASEQTGEQGAFELTQHNADKPSLDFLTLDARLAQFPDQPVWVTNVPTFAEKARLFPEATFALGVDTMARLAQLRFYGGSRVNFDAALDTFESFNTRFLVFGRLVGDEFVTLDELSLPPRLADRCIQVDESRFRNDISSTQLRAAREDDS